MTKKIVYKWVGADDEFIPGVPARDLTQKDIDKRGVQDIVKNSELYVIVEDEESGTKIDKES